MPEFDSTGNGDELVFACSPISNTIAITSTLVVCDSGAYEALPPFSLYLPVVLR